MFQKWMIQLVISFLVRQIAKFGKTIDWSKVKADLEVRIRALVPGTWFDADAVAFCFLIVDAAAAVLASVTEIEKIMKLVAEEKWEEAIRTLKELILRSWPSKVAASEALVACLKEDLGGAAAA